MSFSADLKKNLSHQGDAYLPGEKLNGHGVLLQRYNLLAKLGQELGGGT